MSHSIEPIPSQWPARVTALVLVTVAAALLVPAFYNRFPLVFPDLNGYLNVAYGHYWTLDRPGFYGLFLKPILAPMKGTPGLWLGTAAQALLIAGIIMSTIRRTAPAVRPRVAMGIVLLCSLLTSLPWHAAQLMPDAFTGPLILLTWLAASRDPSAPGTPLLWLATVLLALLHYTHIAIMAAGVAVTLVMALASGTPARQLAKRAMAAVVAFTMVVSAHVAANGYFIHRWSVSPLGSWFLFARLYEDGPAAQWLERHCGRDGPPELCEIRQELPRDSQVLLWSETSPLVPHIQDQVGSPEFWRWNDAMAQVVAGTLREYPVEFAGHLAKATARQFTHFQALDDLCPATCDLPVLTRFRPDAGPALLSSRQLRGDLPKPVVRTITSIGAIAGLVLLVPFLVLARRRRDDIALSLLATIAVCIIVNAALTGGLSDVHDRYQSRVIWLVPFVELLVLARWASCRRGAAQRAFIIRLHAFVAINWRLCLIFFVAHSRHWPSGMLASG